MSSQPTLQSESQRGPGAQGRGARRALAVVASLLAASTLACASAPADKASNQTRAGTLAADQGYWEEAEFRWLKALAIANLNARALNNLAVRQERLGDFELAKELYDKALLVATPAESFFIERNYKQFEPIWERISSGEMAAEETEEAAESYADDVEVGPVDTDGDGIPDLPADQFPQDLPGEVGMVEILISVPDRGPNLAGYDRILVGNFVRHPDSETNLNDLAVRYFRRRITQRTFFETQDLLERSLDPELRDASVLDNAAYWIRAAESVRADLVLTGTLGLTTREESQMVRERIRSPDGLVREVARFQDSVVYKVAFDYIVLRAEDGARLLEGSLEAEQSFPADEGIAESDAIFETLEELLPKLLDSVTPRRSEQSRYLIY